MGHRGHRSDSGANCPFLVGGPHCHTQHSPATTHHVLTPTAAAPRIPPADDQDATARALRHHLETSSDQCLLVFDNATGPAELRPYLPATGQARILITSTNQATTSLGT